MNDLRDSTIGRFSDIAQMRQLEIWNKSRESLVPKSNAVTRRFEIEWFGEDECVHSRTSVGPAIPLFEQAFSAFARGSLIQTSEGAVAVEDLVPGMQIVTVDGGPETLKWVGSMTILPDSGLQGVPTSKLYRVADGSFSALSGMPDALLGTGARIQRNGQGDASFARLCDVGDLVDEYSVIQVTPRSPVRVYHIGLASHRLINVNGLVMETYHPGHNTEYRVSEEMYDVFLSMFPHIRRRSDFGPLNHIRQK